MILRTFPVIITFITFTMIITTLNLCLGHIFSAPVTHRNASFVRGSVGKLKLMTFATVEFVKFQSLFLDFIFLVITKLLDIFIFFIKAFDFLISIYKQFVCIDETTHHKKHQEKQKPCIMFPALDDFLRFLFFLTQNFRSLLVILFLLKFVLLLILF
jgi:hypothetical protein